MEVTSELKHIRLSSRKMRLVAPIVKGRPVSEALTTLRFTTKKAAHPLMQAIKTASADAVHNFKLSEDKLVVKDIEVSDGPTLKRYRPRSRGMAHPVLHRTTSIKVTLEG